MLQSTRTPIRDGAAGREAPDTPDSPHALGTADVVGLSEMGANDRWLRRLYSVWAQAMAARTGYLAQADRPPGDGTGDAGADESADGAEEMAAVWDQVAAYLERRMADTAPDGLPGLAVLAAVVAQGVADRTDETADALPAPLLQRLSTGVAALAPPP